MTNHKTLLLLAPGDSSCRKVEISESLDWSRLNMVLCLSFNLCPFEYTLSHLILCDRSGDEISAPIKNLSKLWNLLSRLQSDSPEYFLVHFQQESNPNEPSSISNSFSSPQGESNVVVDLSLLLPSGLSTEISVPFGVSWNTLCGQVESQLQIEGVDEKIESFTLLNDALLEMSPPILYGAKLWEYYLLAKEEGQSFPCFSVQTQPIISPQQISNGEATTSSSKLTHVRNDVIEHRDFNDQKKNDSIESFGVHILFRLSVPEEDKRKAQQQKSISLSLDYSWGDLTSTVLKEFGLNSKTLSISHLILMDEEEDEVSGKLTTGSKFWKTYLKKYYCGVGTHFDIFLEQLPSEQQALTLSASLPSAPTLDPEVMKQLSVDYLLACQGGNLEDILICLESGVDVNVYQDDGRVAAHLLAARGNIEGLKIILKYGGELISHDDEGMTPLHYSCLENHIATAVWLIDQGANLLAPNVMGLTPLHYICLNSLSPLFKFITRINSNTCTNTGLSLLHCACYRGGNDVIEHLLANGAGVNVVDSNGISALHCAVTNHHLETVKCLVKHGASVNLRDATGVTPFLAACSVGNLEIAKFLQEVGKAAISFSDSAGNNALHLACNQSNSQLIEWLGNLGIRADIRNRAGVTAIQLCRLSKKVDLALWLESISKCEYRDDDLGNHTLQSSGYQVLDDNNLTKDIDSKRMNQQRRLLEACRQCDINAVKNEILTGASVGYFVDENDFLPIHAAAQTGSIQLVQWLIVEAKANINSQSRKGDTALHVACVNNHQELAQWLVISGSDLLITNSEGNTAIHSACASCHSSLVKSLLSVVKNFDINLRNSRNETLLHVSCRAASLDCIFLLLENHCEILVQDDLGRSPLHHACISCTTIAVKTLLDAGAILPIKDHEGYTPFHIACQHGNFDVAEYLLTIKNCPINTVTNIGDTSLHCACTGKNIDLVMILLEAGQDIEGCNVLDETPFEKAMASGSLDICKLLVNQGANLNRINSVTGQYSMHLAAKYGNLRLAMWLAKKNVPLDKTDNSKRTPFLIAAREGQLELLQWFRDTEEVDVHSCDAFENTALHLACEGGHSWTIKWLLSIGLDAQDKNSAGLTPSAVSQKNGFGDLVTRVMQSVSKGSAMDSEKAVIEMADVEKLDDLETSICALEESLKSNDFVIARKIVESLNLFDTSSFQFPFGKTLLHYGAACGHLEFVQYLIIAGEHVDALTDSKRTPLFYAAGKGHLEMVKFLCSHGADPTAKDQYGSTCLSMAIKHHHPEIIQWFSGVIAEHKEQTQQQKQLQQQRQQFLNSSLTTGTPISNPTAFLFSCVADHHTQLPPHSKSSLNLFPSDGITFDQDQDQDSIDESLNVTTATVTAMGASTHHSVTPKGANTQRQEELFTACSAGDLVKARYLIENGVVPLSVQTHNDGYSLLHLSCLSGSIGLVKYFIDKGVDLNCRSHDGSTPLHVACDKQFPEIALYLIESGARVDLHRNDGMAILHLVCLRGMRNLLHDILNLPRSKLPHLDLEETDPNGCTLLHLACRIGNVNLVMFLLGLDLYDINGKDSLGRTPLHYACMSNSVEVVICLSKSPLLQIDPHDLTDCTPLLIACKSGNVNLVRWLNQRGANLFAMTHSKNTALHIAAAIGDQKILEYLIASGLTSGHENLNGYSPVQLAYQNGHDDTVAYLLKHTGALPPNKQEAGGVGARRGGGAGETSERFQVDLALLN